MLGPIGWIILAYEKLFGKEAQLESQRQQQAKANRSRYDERLKQIKKEREEYTKAKDAEIAALEMQIDTLDAEGKATEALRLQVLEAERDKIQGNIDSARAILKIKLDLFEAQAKLNGKSNEDFGRSIGVDFQASVDGYTALLDNQGDALQTAKNNITRFNREQLEKRKQNQQSASDESLTQEDLEAKLLKEIRVKAEQDLNNQIAKIAEEYRISLLSDQEKEVDAVRLKYEQLLIDAKKFGIDSASLKKAQELELFNIAEKYRISLLSDQEKEVDAVRLKYEQLLIDAEKFGIDSASLKKEKELELFNIEEKYRLESLEAENKKFEEQKKAREEQTAQIIASAENVISIVDSLNSIANDKEIARIKKKQADGEKLTNSELKRLQNQQKIEKAIAIAKIATDTAKGISAAVAAGAGLPFPANIPAILSGVSAVLAGVAQANKIINAPAVDVSSGSISSASSPETDQNRSSDPPNTDIFGTGSTQIIPPTKVYVLEQDITDTQGQVAKIKQQATFG